MYESNRSTDTRFSSRPGIEKKTGQTSTSRRGEYIVRISELLCGPIRKWIRYRGRCISDAVSSTLASRNLRVVKIWQIVQTDKPTATVMHKFPVFVGTFENGTNLRDVFKATKVCHCLVKWGKYKNKRPIQQCFNCQQFGHSSAYCGRPPRCVKCDKPHPTQACQKSTEAPLNAWTVEENTPQTTRAVQHTYNKSAHGTVECLNLRLGPHNPPPTPTVAVSSTTAATRGETPLTNLGPSDISPSHAAGRSIHYVLDRVPQADPLHNKFTTGMSSPAHSGNSPPRNQRPHG